MKHVPVLLHEVISFLDPGFGKKFIDATFGGGGHSRELEKAGAKVLGIDQDPEVAARHKVAHGNFADLKTIAEQNDFAKVDGILMDLGLGSHQLDDPVRGFSFQREGPLDMRFDASDAEAKTAAKIVNFYPEKDLLNIFLRYGEERQFGKRITRAILEHRKEGDLETTLQLFELIKRALPAQFRFRAGDVARRIFQALRIAVNDELENLEKGLQQALDLLLPKGKLVVISFHSLEDRIVKSFFVKEAKDCVCPPEFPVCVCQARAKLRVLTRKPITASEFEIKTNSRARSAKLRGAEKI